MLFRLSKATTGPHFSRPPPWPTRPSPSVPQHGYAKKAKGFLSGIKVLGLPPGVTKSMLAREMRRMQRDLEAKEAKKLAQESNSDKVQLDPVGSSPQAPPSYPPRHQGTHLPRQVDFQQDTEGPDTVDDEIEHPARPHPKKKLKKGKGKAKKTAAKSAPASATLSYHEQAMEAANEEKFEASLDLFRLAIKEEPYNPLVHYNLGAVAEASKNYDLALEAFKKAMKMKPEDADIPSCLARVHASLVKTVAGEAGEVHLLKAKEYLEKSLELRPNFMETLINYSHILNELTMYKDSSKLLKKVLVTLANVKNPGEEVIFQMAIANRLLGDAFAGQENFQMALRHYKLSLMLNRVDGETMTKVGEVFHSVFGKHEKALIYFKAALKLNPEQPKLNLLMGALYMHPNWSGHSLDKALEHLQTELMLFPTPEALFQVGFAQMQVGELDKCIDCLEKVRKYKGTDSHNFLQATVLLADVVSSSDDVEALEQAESLYKEALELDSEKAHEDLKGKLGAVLRRLGKFDEALGMLYEAKRDQPQEISVHANLAELFFGKNLDEEGVKVALQILNIDPKHPQANFWVGRAHFKNSQLEKASNFLSTAVKGLPPPIPKHLRKQVEEEGEEMPDYAGEAHKLLGQAYEAQGQAKEALAQFRQATEFNPEDYTLQISLSKLYRATNDAQKADQALRTASVINPTAISPKLELAESLLKDHRYQLAITYFEKALPLAIDAETKSTIYSKLSQCHSELAQLDNDPQQAEVAAKFAELAKSVRSGAQ